MKEAVVNTAHPGLLDDIIAGNADRWVGAEFVDDAYTAVSMDTYVARQFAKGGGYRGVVFQVGVPQGSPALSVNGTLGRSMSKFADEAEVILGRGTKFRIVDVVDASSDTFQQAILQAHGGNPRVASYYQRTHPHIVKLEVIP